ncbi:MAG: formate/nitrite transporter family protein [Clostridia bacterium]|nr:formate/nitrite transporter family protein [Clostridia bacterium]
MAKEAILKYIQASKEKIELLESNMAKYIILSVMSGIYIGFGTALVFSIGAPLKAAGSPGLKALMGASFAIALTLVIFAGSELFTGNNMVMFIGNLSKTVSWTDSLKVWSISFLGNLAGSLLFASAMLGSGLISKSPLRDLIINVSSLKINATFTELFFRGVLCNMLVCLAIWMSTIAKEDTARLFLIFWCLFGFVGAGFEHSVANMSLLGMNIFVNGNSALVSWTGFAYNITVVSLGNIVGGLIIGGVYWYVYAYRKAG